MAIDFMQVDGKELVLGVDHYSAKAGMVSPNSSSPLEPALVWLEEGITRVDRGV
jgi:hypothetical protein